jgi:hypothetical protein
MTSPGCYPEGLIHPMPLTPDLTVPEPVVEEWIPWERLKKKKNHRQAATGRRLDVAEKARR